jgi:hypothetical protein
MEYPAQRALRESASGSGQCRRLLALGVPVENAQACRLLRWLPRRVLAPRRIRRQAFAWPELRYLGHRPVRDRIADGRTTIGAPAMLSFCGNGTHLLA